MEWKSVVGTEPRTCWSNRQMLYHH